MAGLHHPPGSQPGHGGVAYDGKSTDYDDEAGLKRRINAIEREIALGKKQPMRRLAGFFKD